MGAGDCDVTAQNYVSILKCNFNLSILTFETNSFENRTATNLIISFTENNLMKTVFRQF
jgi:hypothetical protein